MATRTIGDKLERAILENEAFREHLTSAAGIAELIAIDEAPGVYDDALRAAVTEAGTRAMLAMVETFTDTIREARRATPARSGNVVDLMGWLQESIGDRDVRERQLPMDPCATRLLPR